MNKVLFIVIAVVFLGLSGLSLAQTQQHTGCGCMMGSSMMNNSASEKNKPQGCMMGKMDYPMGNMIADTGSEIGASGYCPVCLIQGMVMKGNDHFVSEYNGKVYKFFNLEMQKEFIENPDQYTGQVLDTKLKQINK